MASRSDITAELVRQLLDYDPDTGIFRWRARPSFMFSSGRSPAGAAALWNWKHAGKIAGSISKSGYIKIHISPAMLLAHRVAWLYVHGTWPSDQLDHINGDPSDNRIVNLREATQAQNNQNARKPKGGTSKYIGVSFMKHNRKWRAAISIDGKPHYLGIFDSEIEAHAVYLEAKAKHHKFQPVPQKAA